MTWETVLLRDVISPVQGRAGTQALPVYSVTKHSGFVPSSEYFKKQVYSTDLSTYKVVDEGQFAYATIHLDEGSVGVAPSRCVISPMYTVFSIDEARVSRDYLIRFLKSPMAMAAYPRLGRGTAERRKSISLEALGRLEVPLPPLREQRRIASILGEAAALRSTAIRLTLASASLAEAAFRELEMTLSDRPVVPLSEIASVGSGITKGRKAPPTGLVAVPYMTVANVQDKRLDLSKVKTIDASEAEIERYRLLTNDLLLTEGGDPDKLGRGVVWKSELPVSIHQNHVFRVRAIDASVDMTWLSWEMGSNYGKRYFLRAAKRTTGIATINSSQLRDFPVRIPSKPAIATFRERLDEAEALRMTSARRVDAFATLFASLQHRAFRGEL